MTEITIVSWHFDYSVLPFQYGWTKWRYDSKTIVPFTLIDCQSDHFTISEIVPLIVSKTCDTILLENTPSNEKLQAVLANKLPDIGVGLVELTGTVSDLILEFDHLFEETLLLGVFREHPDVAFGEFGSINLVDLVVSDEQVCFPCTKAVLQTCSYFVNEMCRF
jgi:hypothetical protein